VSVGPHSPEAGLRHEIVAILRDLRYGASVQAPIPVLDLTQSEAEFLASLRQWLRGYSSVLAAATSTVTQMSAELDELRRQRAAVRSFLGIPERGIDP